MGVGGEEAKKEKRKELSQVSSGITRTFGGKQKSSSNQLIPDDKS